MRTGSIKGQAGLTASNSTFRRAFLLAVLAIGLIARLGHVFNFYVLPDSYYYLLLADNLRETGALGGQLGPQGMRFPPVGAALFKPAYPLLVSIVDRLVNDLEMSGHIVATGASLFSIVAVYLLAKKLDFSERQALLAAALLALSYNHVFWSGFIMGESLSVLLLLVSMLLAFRKDKELYGNGFDFAAGVIFALALLSRLTFAVLLPVLAWFLWQEFSWRQKRLLTGASGLLLTFSAAASLLFVPFSELLSVINASSDLLLAALLSLLLLGSGFLLVSRGGAASRWQGWRYAGEVFLVLAVFLPVLLKTANFLASLFLDAPPYLALDRFFTNDPVLCLAYLGGLAMLLRSPRRSLALFCGTSASLLALFYYQAASWEYRYLTLSLPFLALPAALGVSSLIDKLIQWFRHGELWEKVTAYVLAASSLLFVIGTTSAVVRPSANRELQSSYPREVARKLAPALSRVKGQPILVSSLAWPYYFHLRVSTWFMDYRKPQETLQYLPEEGEFIFINDRTVFQADPVLHERIERLGEHSLVTRFTMGLQHQSIYIAEPEIHKVAVYRFSAEELQRLFGSR